MGTLELECNNKDIREAMLELKKDFPDKTEQDFADIMEVKVFPAANHSLGHLQKLCTGLGLTCKIVIEGDAISAAVEGE